jgi:FeS assembly SUF system protein
LTVNSINNLVIESEVLDALRTCYDPEIPVNVYELGLIYEVAVNDAGSVSIKMTLTSPHCPAVQSLPAEIESKVKAISGVTDVKIDLVWDPPWDPSKMSEAARLQLGMM